MMKFLAILLSVCSIMQFTAFAEGEAPSAEEAVAEAVTETVTQTTPQPTGYVLSDSAQEKFDFMQKIGILTTITKDDISSDRTIKRGEFAKIAVELYGDV